MTIYDTDGYKSRRARGDSVEDALLGATTDQVAALASVLKSTLACPGIHTTDQETGETFAFAINNALAMVIE